jgi:hypothetical protein
MAEYEFSFRAECGTLLQVGILEAANLSDAISEIALGMDFDADAVAMSIEEKGAQLEPLDRGMHVSGGQR